MGRVGVMGNVLSDRAQAETIYIATVVACSNLTYESRWRWLRKIGSLRGYVSLFGGSDGGPPWAQVVDTGPLATVEVS